jgi:hypothetical protein
MNEIGALPISGMGEPGGIDRAARAGRRILLANGGHHG